MADEIAEGEGVSPLGLVFEYLFGKRGRPGAGLARAMGYSSPRIFRRYARGQSTPEPETLDRIVDALGFPPEAVDVLLFADRLISDGPAHEPASPVALTAGERRRIHRGVLAAAWTVAGELRFELARDLRERKAAAARREARALWEKMKDCTDEERRDLVTVFPEYRSWALAELLAEASARAAADKVENAFRLAHLALYVAERVPDEEAWRFRLMGYVWAFVGNVRRVANDFDGADEAFVRAWELWNAGAASDPGLLAEWRMFDLEASLRRVQERFGEALALLDRAQAACGDLPEIKGRILLKREHVLEQMGDYEGALAVLGEAEPLLRNAQDTRLRFALLFNTVDTLCHLERYGEAETQLPRVRELAIAQANELDLTRVLWLQALVDHGQGREEQAFVALRQVQQYFTRKQLPYDAALSALDLSVMWLQEGRRAEVQELSAGLAWIFTRKNVHKKALAALALFCEAARQEAATFELARQVIREIKRAERMAPDRS